MKKKKELSRFFCEYVPESHYKTLTSHTENLNRFIFLSSLKKI